MKNFLLLSLIFIQVGQGQEVKPLDTIFANEFYNTALFFPAPVRQGVVGAENYTFSYNELEAQSFGLLKASVGEDSNLLVLTIDGGIYSYILSYKKDLPKLNYFIAKEEGIGAKSPNGDTIASEEGSQVAEKSKLLDSTISREEYLKKAATYYLDLKPTKLRSKKKEGIKLSVEKLKYYRDDVFIVVELENRSGISFELDYLRLFLVKGSGKRSGSYQKLQQQQLWSYQEPEVVRHGEARRFVLVFSKFIPGDNEKLILELREQQGNRMLEMNFKP